MHVSSKLNAATILAQSSILRKDVIRDGMFKNTIFLTMDLIRDFYQILMRNRDIPFTEVSTLVVCFNSGWWCGKGTGVPIHNQQMCSASIDTGTWEQIYDVFVHRRVMDEKTEMKAHQLRVCKILTLMREHYLYANLKKCIISVSKILLLYCVVKKRRIILREQGDYRLSVTGRC